MKKVLVGDNAVNKDGSGSHEKDFRNPLQSSSGNSNSQKSTDVKGTCVHVLQQCLQEQCEVRVSIVLVQIS